MLQPLEDTQGTEHPLRVLAFQLIYYIAHNKIMISILWLTRSHIYVHNTLNKTTLFVTIKITYSFLSNNLDTMYSTWSYSIIKPAICFLSFYF